MLAGSFSGEMHIPGLERLTVNVHLMSEPCLWCWEIVDAEHGALVESSWATEWTGYTSSREALQAGVIRLTNLTRGSRRAPLHARLTPADSQRTQTRYLVVVARAATELYASLRRTFEGRDNIEVIRDRRFGERRKRDDAVGHDRRRGDRRSLSDLDGLVRWCEGASAPRADVSASRPARQS